MDANLAIDPIPLKSLILLLLLLMFQMPPVTDCNELVVRAGWSERANETEVCCECDEIANGRHTLASSCPDQSFSTPSHSDLLHLSFAYEDWTK